MVVKFRDSAKMYSKGKFRVRVRWKSDIDTFSLNSPREVLKYTKRNFLSKFAMLFDPLGFLAPFTIIGKMLF